MVTSRMLTPQEFADQLNIDVDKVRGWGRSGKLPSVDLSDGGSRPTYRIDERDAEAFLKKCNAAPNPAAKARSTRAKRTRRTFKKFI